MTAHATRTVPGHLPTMGGSSGSPSTPWEPSYAAAVAVEALTQLGATTAELNRSC
jgi:hypothetical protein